MSRLCVQALCSSARHERSIRAMAARHTRELLRTWLGAARRFARNRRVSAAHRTMALAGLLRAVWQQWRIAGTAAGRRLLLEEAASLQVRGGEGHEEHEGGIGGRERVLGA